MKKTLLNILCGLLCAALLVSALCIGAVRGWQGEREKALTVLSDELTAQLEDRAMDAANLAVVVARHVDASDERLAQLKQLRAELTSQTANTDAIIRADAALTELAQSLGQTLPSLGSVQASARDQAYISSLTRTLSESTGLSNAYELLAQGFNNRLTSSLTGGVARLFGVSLISIP